LTHPFSGDVVAESAVAVGVSERPDFRRKPIDYSCGFDLIAVDVSGDYEQIEKKLLSLEDEIAPVFMLINCAGAAVCGRLEDTDPSDIKVSHFFPFYIEIIYLKLVFTLV